MALVWAVGTIFGFPTPSLFDESGATGRFSAGKVIGIDRFGQAVVAALDLVTESMPDLDDARSAAVLLRQRFSYDGSPAVLGVRSPTAVDRRSVEVLGRADLTDDEVELAAACKSLSVVGFMLKEMELEWRWRHERQELIARTTAKRAAEEDATRHDERNRQEHLDLELLASEVAFQRWQESPPFPPTTFTKAARDQVHHLARRLLALDGTPSEDDVRVVLGDGVAWFNRADAEAGHVIETEEREDIARTIAELATASGHPHTADVLDDRTW